jgi:predicted transcriptional regulator
VYEPVVSKSQYGDKSLKKILGKYFGNSPQKMVAHLIKKEDLSLKEINDLMKKIKEE